MLGQIAKKKSKAKSKPVKRPTAADILARVHAEEADRQAQGRKEMSKRRRQEIKEKQRAAAVKLWAPGGRLRKLQKERKKQAGKGRKSG